MTSGDKRIHSSLTAKRICEAVERSHRTLENPGFCLSCGVESDGVEPDAEHYQCESCGEDAVCGAEQIMLSYVLH